jgi:hypothetical protein
MKTMLWPLAVLAIMIASPASADKRDQSANYYLPACRHFLNGHVRKDLLRQGQCVGMVETLNQLAAFMPSAVASCSPDSVTVGQAVTVVVRWLNQRPNRWNENFMMLTLLALRDAWPCN